MCESSVRGRLARSPGAERLCREDDTGVITVDRSGAVHFETPIAAAVEASAATRGLLDGWLSAAVGQDCAETVRLAASELATNAVRHGRLPADAKMRLLVDIDDRSVRVALEQPTSAADARVVAPENRGVGGFGLAIVAGMSDAWGVEAGPPGSVWFEVDRFR
jgi:anti-sigma regulatory factor (Ser/Thr protein kinase)